MQDDRSLVASRRHYLDHNATAPMRPEVREAVLAAMGRVGNASSVHAEGRAARAALDDARGKVAALAGWPASTVVFTSGGTEANNMALRPGALVNADGRPATRLLVGATDHASVLEGHGFEQAAHVPVGPDGVIDLAALRDLLGNDDGVPLLSIAAANSETGVLAPIAEARALVNQAGGCLHVDAVQAAGRVDLSTIGVDALSVSGHKLGGPQGTGALLVAPGRAGPSLPLFRGGSQENRRRAGTENVAGLVGLGVAAALARHGVADASDHLLSLREQAERAVRRSAPDAVVFGDEAERLPNTVLFAVPGLSAETALMALDLAGIAVSSGSACSSGKVVRSHVLAAMGVDASLASGAIRLSFGWSSTAEDVSAFANAFDSIVHRLYERRARRAA